MTVPMPMMPPPVTVPLWHALCARLGAWHRRRALRAELDTVDLGDLREILRDLNVDADALPVAVDGSGLSRVLLPAMLERVGLDGAAVERRHPAIANDLRRVCAACTVKSRCTGALEGGTSALRCMAFCPNAQTLHALRREARAAA